MTQSSKHPVSKCNDLEAEPHVGICWLHHGEVIISSTALSKAERYGDCLGHAASHVDHWTALQRTGAVFPETEYEESPRGRVVYYVKTGQFTLYADQCILGNEAAVGEILSRLHLPQNTKRETDYHYRCSRCLYGNDDADDDEE